MTRGLHRARRAGARSSDPEVLSLLPNIEDPHAPMLHPASPCAPLGFGVVGRAWLPRRPLAGTFDFAWKRDRWPLAPRDFDPAFHQSAPIGQQLDEYEGGELMFPEYGDYRYKPPAGAAAVFACSLLHEALPVTRGRRFALLSFLLDPETPKSGR